MGRHLGRDEACLGWRRVKTQSQSSHPRAGRFNQSLTRGSNTAHGDGHTAEGMGVEGAGGATTDASSSDEGRLIESSVAWL